MSTLRTLPLPLLPLPLLLLAVIACGPEIPTRPSASTGGNAAPPETPSSVATSEDASVPSAPSSPSTPSPSSPSGAEVDATAVLAPVVGGAYQTSAAFTEVTRAAYASAAVTGAMVREWVSTSSLTTYEGISPEVSGSNLTLPVGTTIVRAVLDEDGGVGELTVMYKGPAGYNAALGDWWFGVTDPDGSPLEADGGPEVGQLQGCYSCHIPRSDDDFVFGVPLGDRSAAAGGGDAGTSPTEDAGFDAGSDDAGTDAGDDAGGDGGHGHHHG